MNTVAVCIPTFNQAPYLTEAVRSAYAQDIAGVEVWISDDASTDATPEVIAQLTSDFPGLRAFRQAETLGLSGNPKWIVRQPAADYIVKLDSDDRLHPGYVRRLTALLEAHPEAGYAHCSVFQINDHGAVTRVRRLARPPGFQSAEASLHSLCSGFRAAANVCMFRRRALAEVDYYKHGLAYSDDWDLAVRLADAGWGNVYCDEVLADYRVWDSASQVRARRKLGELLSSLHVFEETLTPAYTRRGWSLAPVTAARERYALDHSIALLSPLFSAAERQELMAVLCRIGDSPALQRRLAMYRLGLGPVLQWREAVILKLKDAAKAALRPALAGRNA